jgi:hypothetical protein
MLRRAGWIMWFKHFETDGKKGSQSSIFLGKPRAQAVVDIANPFQSFA